ncbi:hypothetical protein EI94DRAFT_1809107 [Lactarius quietus]|nr:hypothetical protein EI94DRAFT_1809107 [Lactarius quietus]
MVVVARKPEPGKVGDKKRCQGTSDVDVDRTERPTPIRFNITSHRHAELTTLTSSHSVLFSSTSSSLLAFPAASSTTRNTTGSTPYAAAASTTSNVAMTGSTDAGITPRTSGSRRTTNGTRISVSCAWGRARPLQSGVRVRGGTVLYGRGRLQEKAAAGVS